MNKKWRSYGREKQRVIDAITPTLAADQGNMIKQNTERLVKIIDNRFVSKLDSPSKSAKKLRGLFFSKVKAEYETGIMLEKQQIPVVKYLGWAKSGADGILVSELLKDSVSAHDFWFNDVVTGNYEKSLFLNALSDFLKSFLSANCSHPDFHLGNILFQSSTNSFKLVDVYGIKKHKALSSQQKYDLHKFIFSLRSGLTSKELHEFMISCGITKDIEQSKKYLTRIETIESDAKKSQWTKRKRQIINNYSKFVTVCTDPNILIKNIEDKSPIIQENSVEFKKRKTHFRSVQCSFKEAQEIWLQSFYLRFFAVPHVQPIILEKISDSIAILYFSSPDTEYSSATSQKELLRRCKLAETSEIDTTNNIETNEYGYLLLDIKDTLTN